MKARIVPLFFDPGRDADFDKQLDVLRSLLIEEAEFLAPLALGGPLPQAEAVVFPQLLGEAYRQLPALRSLELPILILTSEFGTLSMWDWELIEYLKSEGINTIAPYQWEQTQKVVRALRVQRELTQTKFLVYQDNPGEGFQAGIFKRFYWWEDECTERLEAKFGITIVKKSFRQLGAKAKEISDPVADQAIRRWGFLSASVSSKALRSAAKICIAVEHDLDQDDTIRSVGINCLNESHYSDTTPCLAWNVLFQERGIIWGCEADTMSMMSKYLVHRSLETPIMMTNLYPFLMGDAALKHERIERFPEVGDNPENYLLVAHCGFMGVIPQSFSTEWTLRKKVLAIVDENATAIDARLPCGPITLAKLHPTMDKMTVAEGELTTYAQFPNSDCLNGGVIKVRDGHKLMDALASHHYLLTVGHNLNDIRMLSKVFGFAIVEI